MGKETKILSLSDKNLNGAQQDKILYEKQRLIQAASLELYIALKAMLSSDDNRSAIAAVELAKKAMIKAELGTTDIVN